jgi:transposase
MSYTLTGRYVMRPVGTPDELERRRLRAVALLTQGRPPFEVARMIGVDRRSVRRWKAAYGRKGRSALEARPACGRPPKLPAAQTHRLERELLRGAKATGFPTDLWTCPRVARLIERRFRVHYHVDHIGRLLHSLGWSPQKPARRAVERDEERDPAVVQTNLAGP